MQITVSNKRIAIILSSTVLIISVVALILSIAVAKSLQRKVAERQMSAYLDKVELETEVEFNNLYLTLNIVRDWAKSEDLVDKTHEDFNNKFIPLISNTPQVSAISVVASTGETFSIRHESPNFESYFTLNDSLDTKNVMVLRNNKEYELIEDTILNYTVTSLPSFKKHMSKEFDTVSRYQLQLIPGTTKLAGTAFSIKTVAQNGVEYTITAYKSLYRLHTFLNSVKVSENSQVYLFTRDGRYFDYQKLVSANSTSTSVDGYLVDFKEYKNTNFYAAYLEWDGLEAKDSIAFVEYQYNGDEYMAVIKPNRDSVNGIWTALVMSQTDFAIVLKGQLGIVFTLALVFLVLSMVMLFVFIRRASNAESINLLDDIELGQLIKQGENDFVEFKSTVRLNLHSNKMGKEIELAWLKSVVAFCNTEGGRILIGVKDNGEILGLESDRFPNDDKTLLHIQNLIKQHVGLEFAKYIHYSLREIEDKKILVVRCQPISTPMFLRFNDKEQFFVRSGPASIELPVSKALQYIKERGN